MSTVAHDVGIGFLCVIIVYTVCTVLAVYTVCTVLAVCTVLCVQS